jgi:hypothetical protein
MKVSLKVVWKCGAGPVLEDAMHHRYRLRFPLV